MTSRGLHRLSALSSTCRLVRSPWGGRKLQRQNCPQQNSSRQSSSQSVQLGYLSPCRQSRLCLLYFLTYNITRSSYSQQRHTHTHTHNKPHLSCLPSWPCGYTWCLCHEIPSLLVALAQESLSPPILESVMEVEHPLAPYSHSSWLVHDRTTLSTEEKI